MTAGEGLPCSKDALLGGWKAVGTLLDSRKWSLSHQAQYTLALTCSTSPRKPSGPLPARAAGIARPGGSRPRAAAIGSPVDGSVVNKSGSEVSNMGSLWPRPSSVRMHPAHLICLWMPGQHHFQGLRGSLPKGVQRGWPLPAMATSELARAWLSFLSWVLGPWCLSCLLTPALP